MNTRVISEESFDMMYEVYIYAQVVTELHDLGSTELEAAIVDLKEATRKLQSAHQERMRKSMGN